MNTLGSSRPGKGGFTLIELLTVIAIIGILAAILIPTVGRVRYMARNSQCVANLREWQRLVLLYANDNKGNFTSASWASGTYGSYTSSEMNLRIRVCPAYPEARETGNNRVTYVMSRAIVNGSVKDTNPVAKVRDPARYLLFCDSTSSSGAAVDGGRGVSNIDAYIKPLFDPTLAAEGVQRDIASRHRGGPINAVFLDGHVQNVTGTPLGGNDRRSIYENRLAWFPDLGR